MEQSWECETPLLHCPISLILAVTCKAELEQVKGILIAPVWKGQVWWTAVMRITVRWKKLGDSQTVLKEGAWMKRHKQKLLPRKIVYLLRSILYRPHNSIFVFNISLSLFLLLVVLFSQMCMVRYLSQTASPLMCNQFPVSGTLDIVAVVGQLLYGQKLRLYPTCTSSPLFSALKLYLGYLSSQSVQQQVPYLAFYSLISSSILHSVWARGMLGSIALSLAPVLLLRFPPLAPY
ncbi:MAG: hypothetical protein EZS28_036579 [Streblomastix strix]|uniref:Uncharacterized protein n=1 Tax=Streblomastix strix TaxID=222440 RepID=A0A5J4UAM6_9EUKA|nr:MAG: hypothetical protein EZS28_036579 [Streblomastix strix]